MNTALAVMAIVQMTETMAPGSDSKKMNYKMGILVFLIGFMLDIAAFVCMIKFLAS